MTKILIDTNTYSYLVKGNEKVVKILEYTDVIYFSVIVVGEILTWFKFGNKIQFNKDELEKFINNPSIQVVNVSTETAEIYSDLYIQLKKIGKMIPVNDLWIAAQTIEYGAKLITFDRDFTYIPGLRVELLN